MDTLIIRSRENKRFKLWKKLKAKKERDQHGLFLAEGEHLAEEALKAGWPVADIVLRENAAPSEAVNQLLKLADARLYRLASALFDELADTQTPQGIILVLRKPDQSLDQSLWNKMDFILMVDEIRDPGNLGTIIRTADAAGVDALLYNKGTTDPFGEKVLRATQGSLFHLPLYQVELTDVIQELRRADWCVLGSSPRKATDLRDFHPNMDQKLALLIGNEARGMSASLTALTDINIKIPLFGQAESLNVSVATGILLYHLQLGRKVGD